MAKRAHIQAIDVQSPLGLPILLFAQALGLPILLFAQALGLPILLFAQADHQHIPCAPGGGGGGGGGGVSLVPRPNFFAAAVGLHMSNQSCSEGSRCVM